MSQAAYDTRRYGFPYRGLSNSVERHEAMLDAITNDSHDILIRAAKTKAGVRLSRRQGSASVGSTAGVTHVPVADATLLGLDVFRVASPSVTSGYPVHGLTFADESRRFGLTYLRDTNGPTDYTLGEEFSSTHYPTAASTVGNLKAIPLPYDGNGATGLMRFAYEENRRRECAGTRRRAGMRQKDCAPSFYATPRTWNRRYNYSSGAGSEKVRIAPMGHTPPLWAPTFPSASYPANKATAAPWTEGDTFFASVMYEYDDGSFGPPFLPSDKNSDLTAGLGLVTVLDDGDATAEYYDFIPWRNIPVPTPGVVRVWLLRSPKVSKTSVAAGSWPNLSDLRICGYVPAGVTSYDDPNGNDLSLVADTTRVRFDHKWPERARYAWTFDQRMALGYLRPNACAVIVAPVGSVADYDFNGNDEFNGGTYFFHFQISALALNLKKTVAGVTTSIAFSLGTTISLQTLVNRINATTSASACGMWRAALVPGVQGSLPSTYLANTSQALACTFAGSSTAIGSAALFGDVPEGCKVYGTNIPAGAYVKSKASASALTLSAATTGAGPATLTFAVDTGDDSIPVDATKGNVRCFTSAYYGVLPFLQSYLDTYETRVRDLVFTGGGTTHARSAPDSWYTAIGNSRSAVHGDKAGILMGGAALSDGCLVFYSKQIYLLRNMRAGGTGEDADYQMFVIEAARGCVSPFSIVEGNGWAGCMTDDGFWVYDGTEKALISPDVYAREADASGHGEWAYEIAQCSAIADSDSTGYGCYAAFADGRLWVNYRTGASNAYSLCYDASGSVDLSGLAQLRQPDGTLFGWSSRLGYSWRSRSAGCSGALGVIRSSSGSRILQADNRNDKTTCGLVQQNETPGAFLDGADPVHAEAYFALDFAGTLKKKALRELRVLYRFVNPSSDLNFTLWMYTTQDRTAAFSRSLSATPSADTVTRAVKKPPLAARRATDSLEFSIAIDGSSGSAATDVDFYGLEADMQYLDSHY